METHDFEALIPDPDFKDTISLPQDFYPDAIESTENAHESLEDSRVVSHLEAKFNDPKTPLADLSSLLVLAKQYIDSGVINISEYRQFEKIIDSRQITEMLIYRIEGAHNSAIIKVILESADQSLNATPPLITREQHEEIKNCAQSKIYSIGVRASYKVDTQPSDSWLPYKD